MQKFNELGIGDHLFLILPDYKIEETVITDLTKRDNYTIFTVKYLNGAQYALKAVPLSLLCKTYMLTAATNKHDANIAAKLMLSIDNIMHRKPRI